MADQTTGFNLKAVIHETGLSAETLHAWERRYGLPKPERTPGGHRLYSLRDIQILNWLSARQKEGMSISRGVSLWRSLEAEGQDPLLIYTPHKPLAALGGVRLDELCQAWVDACLDFDERVAEQILAQAFALYAPEVVCTDLLQKGLSIIGANWYIGETSVQQEHFASALAMRRLYTLSAAAPSPTRPGRILAVCPAGEEHEFSLLLLTVLLQRRGWEVVYLGANVPIMRFESVLRVAAPNFVISVSQTLPSAASLRRMGEFLSEQGVLLAYGGGIFNTLPSLQEFIPGHYLGNEHTEAIQTVERIWSLKLPIQQALPVPPDHRLALQRYLEFHRHIEIFVGDAMREEGIQPAHLEIAISALQHHLTAALTLGDIRLVENSLNWLAGLLENYGLPKSLMIRFFEVYQLAIETYIPSADRAVFSRLTALIRETSQS